MKDRASSGATGAMGRREKWPVNHRLEKIDFRALNVSMYLATPFSGVAAVCASDEGRSHCLRQVQIAPESS